VANVHINELKQYLENEEIDIKFLITQYFGEKVAIDFLNKIKGTS
jgi:hypothetical protein